jgi:hypothetical protein
MFRELQREALTEGEEPRKFSAERKHTSCFLKRTQTFQQAKMTERLYVAAKAVARLHKLSAILFNDFWNSGSRLKSLTITQCDAMRRNETQVSITTAQLLASDGSEEHALIGVQHLKSSFPISAVSYASSCTLEQCCRRSKTPMRQHLKPPP